jgi:glycyl-tRNA synthetase beta chain
LCAWIARGDEPAVAQVAAEAARLCKTDLTSEMIGSGKEYASLEGQIGAYYALRAGVSEVVSKAIYYHYKPKGNNDSLPITEAGQVLSLADKLDNVAGAFVIGKVPSGSEDPYGVRRAGNGIVRLLVRGKRHISLREASMEATRPFFEMNPDLPQGQIMLMLGEFWWHRVWSIVGGGIEDNVPAFYPDHVEAAMEAESGGVRGWSDPYDCYQRTLAVSDFRSDPRFAPLVILFKRVANIIKASTEPLPEVLDASRLTEPAERALLDSLERARAATAPLWKRRAYDRILPELLAMEASIHGFFDGVMVNVDDAPTRLNRLRLLADVRELFVRGWNFSKIVVEGEKSA